MFLFFNMGLYKVHILLIFICAVKYTLKHEFRYEKGVSSKTYMRQFYFYGRNRCMRVYRGLGPDSK